MWKQAALLIIVFAATASFAKDNDENWIEVRSPHFSVLTDASEKQARHIAGQFERMREIFRTGFPMARTGGGSPIQVIALKDKKGFQALEPEAYLAKGQMNLAGLFLRTPDKNYILLRLDAQGPHPYATIYHEYTHLLMGSAGEWLPLWLNEGLAEFYQNTDIRDKEVQTGEPSPENILLLRQVRLLPLETLLAVDAKSPYYHEEEKAFIFYAESWAFVHLLKYSDSLLHLHRLPDYVDMVSKGVDPVVAGERAFGDLRQMQKALQDYVEMNSFRYQVMPAPKNVDESAYSVSAVPPPQANAVRADFLAHNGRDQDARALLETVLQEDPKNASAHETMGFLELRAGKLDAARSWYEQAMQLDSQSYLAHYHYAAISMNSSLPVKQEDIEASLRTAIKLNPGFAPAYDLLASFYGRRHEKLDEAHLLNVQSTQLDPGNLQYRLNTASLLQEADRSSDALLVLKAAAPLARTPEQAATVDARIQSLQQQVAREPAGTGARTAPPATESAGMSLPHLSAPKHPTEEPSGPKRTATGVIQGVQCSDPSTIELRVQNGSAAVSLYSNNYYDVRFSAANFTPEGEIHPCADLEGMKASVQYTATSDKTVDGQILSVELSK